MKTVITCPLVRALPVLAVLLFSASACASDNKDQNKADSNDKATVTAANDNSNISDVIAHGEEAHKNHCYKCHTDQVYTRDNHFVKSLDALSKQVVRCKNGSNIPWFDEDADAVVQFLNQKYYKF